MGKIYYLPLEHIDMRYTSHLDKDIVNWLSANGYDYVRIYPDVEKNNEIKQGSFLDAPYTIEFKMKQIAELAKYYKNDEIKAGDIIFASDIWFPGLESIAYMNYFCSKDVKVRGLLHAGSFTDTDFVRDMERWAKNFEDAIFDIVDEIFVGSEFMAKDLTKKRLVNKDKLYVTGFPLDYQNLGIYKNNNPKKNIVIFNGRNVDEKQPWLFKELEKQINREDITFVNTQENKLSKDKYYELLSQAKVIVSFDLQENFGFGILEAVELGCIPIVPKRLVYPEHFKPEYLYDNFLDCINKVKKAIGGELKVPTIQDYRISIQQWFN